MTISNPIQNDLRTALWPQRTPRWSKLCAVLDCARDERIFTAVEAARLDKCCLYAGRLPWALVRAAPHLVVLEPEDRFTNLLMDEGWGKSWGIYFRTEVPMMDVRRHLRTFLRVKDEQGRILIFRWYDPRVLRRYLPTCNAGELATVFGPIDRFICESADAKSVLEYAVEEGRLLSSEHVLGSRNGTQITPES